MKPIGLSLTRLAQPRSLSLSLSFQSLPGGCLSQSLSHLQGARLRSSLSWRGSLRRDRAAAAAAEGGAGGGGGSLIVCGREESVFSRVFFSSFREREVRGSKRASSRPVALSLSLSLAHYFSIPLSPFLFRSNPLAFLQQQAMTSVAMRTRASAVTSTAR